MSKQYGYKGYTIRIEPDDDPLNPRTEWDNMGTMICFHKRYELGDKHEYSSDHYSGWDELRSAIEKEEDAAIILPLFLMDHSGLSMSYSSSRFSMCDSAGWDWGCVGFIFVSRKKLREEYSKKRISKKTLELAEKVLMGEVETYDQYLTGDVWGYIIENDDDDHIESCWGFFGYDYCKEEAEGIVDHMVKNNEERAAELKRVQAAQPCCQP
jgi:hypothetical protein